MLFKRLSYSFGFPFGKKGRIAKEPDGFKRFGFLIFTCHHYEFEKRKLSIA